MKVTERFIASIWQRRLASKAVTDKGEQIQVIHPGRVSNISGCDFRDAVFIINGKRTEGNIEVHVKSSHWYHHGHHRDPRYNNIALHIVWWHDSQSPTQLQNGKPIPTICLSSSCSGPLGKLHIQANSWGNPLTSCPEVGRYSNVRSLSSLLTAAGEERFAAKRNLFRKALNGEEAGQVLYRGIARAIGYAQNADACEELSNRLPISVLEEIRPRTDATGQALILGTAGLLPSQRPGLQQRRLMADAEIDELERIWRSIGIIETMKSSDWCFFRVRPHNFPTRRLIALSYLLARYHQTGLDQGILKLVKTAPPKKAHRWLESSLSIACQGYWENHSDFGIAMKRSATLLGHEKASEIIINTILPFNCAWGEISSDLKLKKKAIEIYRQYPRSGDNELTRYMKQQLELKPFVQLSVCQQQGLIHIFKTYCRHRNCAVCPIALNRD